METIPTLTPELAAYIVERAIREKKLTLSDVTRYQSEVGREIQDLEARIASLRGPAGNGSVASQEPASRVAAAQAAPRRSVKKRSRKASSPEVTAQRKIGGRYMGLMRSLPESKRKAFSRIKEAQGFEAAIAAIEASRK